MKIHALHRTSEYRGDHSADVAVAYEVLPGETVEALMLRVFGEVAGDYVQGGTVIRVDHTKATREWLELRLVEESGT